MNKALTTTPQQRVTLSFPKLIKDCIGSEVSKQFETTIEELAKDLNTGIEKGVATSTNSRNLDSLVQLGRGAEKVAHNIRMEFTRPLDAAKRKCQDEEAKCLKPVVDATRIANNLCIAEANRIATEERKATQDAIDEQNRLDAEARAKEEKNKNISLGKGGTGIVKPVIAEQVQMPISMAAMTNTTKIKYRVDDEKIRTAVDAGERNIPGIRIYPVWNYVVEDRKQVPMKYKKATR